MRRSRSIRRAVVLVSMASATLAAAASANDMTGGAGVAGTPSVEAVTCADGRLATCSKGAALTVSGMEMAGVGRVVFLGRRGRGDDRAARPTTRTDSAVVVTVPSTAHTGPLALDAGGARVRVARVRVTPPTQAAPAAAAGRGELFPIAGKHTYGATSTNRFGGRRGHQGQDVFARCGTPLVAVGDGTILKAAFEANAGNYVVVQRADGTSNAYMHMRDPAVVAEGEPVTAGQALGVVGETGRASGCHLHFELWTAPGWYRGGHAVDPPAALRGWDTAG